MDAELRTPDAPPGDETAADKVVAKTPWWAISTAFHVVVALICAYMVVLARPADADTTTQVVTSGCVLPPPVFKNPETSPIESLVTMPTASETPSVMRIDDQPIESDDDDWHKAMKGQNEKALDRSQFNSLQTNSSIGVGGGASGSKGGPFGGRKLSGGPGGRKGCPTDDAVLSALRWLARHQNADGGWGVQTHTGRCGKLPGSCAPNPTSAVQDFDTGVTGLALLAFLGAGYSHLSKDMHDGISFGTVVRTGLQKLMTVQDAEGCIGARVHKYMYNHSIAALAMIEAFGLTGSTLFQDNAQRAVDFLVRAQNPGKGWRYEAASGDNDTSVTGWAVMALKSAELCQLKLPRSSYDGVRAWLDEVTEENYYRVGYTFKGTGKVYCAHNEAFNHHEALTAIAVMSRAFMDKRRNDPRIRGGVELMIRDLPSWNDKDVDFYYWYYASLALFQVEDGQGDRWKKWNDAMVSALLKHQNPGTSGCKFGSWEPVDRWSCEAGRVYATAINALTLEVTYRYTSVFTGATR
jgi:hypothetical protein